MFSSLCEEEEERESITILILVGGSTSNFLRESREREGELFTTQGNWLFAVAV